MPRHNGRGRGGGSRRGHGGGRGGGGGGGGFRGGRGASRGGRGGNRGAIRKKTTGDIDPYMKFKHIQRNQEAEDLLRQRKQLESNHQKQMRKQNERVVSSDEDEEPNAMDQLLQSLQTTNKKGKKSDAIESSDSEMSGLDDEGDDELSGDEVDGEGSDEEVSGEDDDIDGEEEEDLDDEEMEGEAEDSDDEDDFEINEQFEEQSKKIVPTSKQAKDEPNSLDDEDEIDSSDEDEDQILRPEESKAPSKTPTKSPSKKDYVICDSNDDDSEEEVDSDQDDAEEQDNPQTSDIFSIHLDNELSPDLLECVNTTHSSVNHELNWPKLGRLQVDIPNAGLDRAKGDKKRSKTMLLDEDETYAQEGQVPKRLDHKSATVKECGIKNQMHPHVRKANSAHLQASPSSALLTGLQSELFSIMNNYQDLYYPARTHDNGEEIRFSYCLHALNHILKTRTKILHHNSKLSKIVAEKGKGPSILPESFRDQGLFRPKVLIVVPFRESALRVVNMLISLIFPELGGKVAHYARFQEEFGGEGLYFPKRNPKPEDYEKTFAGNSDDTFRIGMCITRKSMKLYSDFYSSDILIVSPLGLRMIVGAPGEKDRDYDFLASIELMILDQAELFLAQNWDHLLHVLDHLHLQPQSARNTDFSRVRSWCLNGWTRFYRQTLLFTSHELPEFRSLFNSRCANYRGKVRVANPVETGTIRHVAVQVAQLFHRVEVTSIQTSFDQRFNHFINTVLPQFKGASMAHSLILVPSYFDFVRLRNYFKKESVNFVQICEYTKDAKVARSRDMFFHSGAHFMLYSERAHFFRRTRVKGIRHLIMYQPPTWPHFYPELINLMQEAYQNPRDGGESSMTVTVLYTKYDMLQVSAIVGSERAAQMAASDKVTHMFMTGE